MRATAIINPIHYDEREARTMHMNFMCRVENALNPHCCRTFHRAIPQARVALTHALIVYGPRSRATLCSVVVVFNAKLTARCTRCNAPPTHALDERPCVRHVDVQVE